MKFIVCLLLVKICSFVAEEQNVDEIMYKDNLTIQRCKSHEFDCGNKCIDSNLVCDGKEDCASGADEHNDYCIIDHTNATCPYPVLPSDRYNFSMNFSSKTNSRVPEFVQGVFRCKPGFFGDPVNEMVSTCFQRSWEPPIMLCKRICPVINNSALEQICFQGSRVDCNGIIWERTLVRFACQKMHHDPTFGAAYCLPNGKWSLNPSQIECRPRCGYIGREAAEILQHRDFPWRVIIREQWDHSTRYFSGTLIDKKMVLTDGDLFTRSKNPDDFEILVNDDIDSWGPPKSYQVKNIHFLPARFQKHLSPDAVGNLAILEPYEEVEFTLTVLPACILPYSYPATLETFQDIGHMIKLLDDSNSTYLDRDGISAIKLQSLQGICKRNSEKCNQYYGKLNVTSSEELHISSINQGTGLIKTDKELKLYFLEGIYSRQDPESDDLLIFTFASDYIEWIDEIRDKTKKYNTVKLKNENTSTDRIANQTESETPPTKRTSLLTIFVLLSFVILLAVLFRIK